MKQTTILLGVGLVVSGNCASPVQGYERKAPARSGVGLRQTANAFLFSMMLSQSAQETSSLLDKEYQTYQELARRGSTERFFRSNAPMRYKEWLREAEKGNSVAALFVARCCFGGITVPLDGKLALKWATLSAQQGNTFAMNLIGNLYNDGVKGITKNRAEGMRWYHRGAEQGNSVAMANLGIKYADTQAADHDHTKSLHWYQKSAEMGYAFSMWKMGELYASGLSDKTGEILKKDAVEAKKWYRKAADAGDSDALALLMKERITPAFKSFVAANATEQAKATAVAAVREALPEFKALDFAAATAVLDDVDGEVATLREDTVPNPLLILHDEMVQHYSTLFQKADSDEQTANLNQFAVITRQMVEKLFAQNKLDEVVTFWKTNYARLPVAQLIQDQKEEFVQHSRICISALLKTGNRKQGKQLLQDNLTLCDTILEARPWDWYLKNAYMGLCFQAAETLAELKEDEMVQPLLRRGWGVMLKQFGKEALLDRYATLPLKGRIPKGASTEDAEFFKNYASGLSVKSYSMSRFTVPTDFAGVKYPFHIYVLKGPNGHAELMDQFRWVKEYRGGTVPKEVVDSFDRLYKIAVENNVDFRDLCVYALGTANEDGKEKEKDKKDKP